MADPVHELSPPDVRWSRNNAAEAVPGILMPLSFSFFGPILEVAARQGWFALGVLPRSETSYPDSVGGRIFGAFHGHYALNANELRRMMSALPGVSGDDVDRDMLGFAPEGGSDKTDPRRAAAVALKFPVAAALSGRRARECRIAAGEWWSRSVGPDGPRPGIDSRALMREAVERFSVAMALQCQTRMIFQGTTAQLIVVAEGAGEAAAASSLLSATAGIEEAVVADDLWELAHGRMTLDRFVADHGFHGPNSGDVSARSWREDPGPLSRLLEAVRSAERPADRRTRAQAESSRTAAVLLDSLSASDRLRARALMRFGAKATRNLERTKNSFLIAIDGARAAARGIGEELVADGRLEDRDDVFFLTVEEALRETQAPLAALIDERREQREAHLAVEVPDVWLGQPEPRPRGEHPRDGADAGGALVSGSGVAPGVAEGRACVVLDPADDPDIDQGDVLVAPTTDPSWVPLMTIASALVIDIGTAASHGAVIARELGVPCVIGTKTGTSQLRTGDRLRVDGGAGTVEILDQGR